MSVSNTPVRLGVAGARRGRAGMAALKAFPSKVKLQAVCDPDKSTWEEWIKAFPGVRCYTDYEQLLHDDEIDAVLIATPLPRHAEQSLDALRAGKHVLSEVPACHTLDQCWELVETAESTGLTYMMAENYCYMRSNMMVLNMVQQGLFGELVHAEGAYIHDCKAITHNSSGQLAWRGEINRDWNWMTYPTHSIGPVSQWLGVNKEGGDRFDHMIAVNSKPKSMHRYFRSLFGADHPGADPSYWNQGDSQTAVITTEKGVTINIRVDWISPRPHNMTHYALQGTEGAFISARHSGEPSLIWMEGVSPGLSPARGGQEATWEHLSKYEEEHDHPLWKKWSDLATRTGHGGGDFFVLLEFVDAILEKRAPLIDVYDAVTWSAMIPLSAQSIAQNGAAIPFPDFTRNRNNNT